MEILKPLCNNPGCCNNNAVHLHLLSQPKQQMKAKNLGSVEEF